MKRTFSFLLLCAVLLAACKKNETAPSKGTLTGSLSIKCVNYIAAGQTVSFTTDHRLYHPKNGTLSYTWKISSFMDSYVPGEGTDNGFTYTFDKDTLGTFTVTCMVTPSGDYYSTSANEYVTLVKGGIGINKAGKSYECSLPLDYDSGKDSLWLYQDSTYVSTRIGGRHWMRCNLAAGKARSIGTTTGTAGRDIGVGFRGYGILKDVLGCYYTWEEAVDACPEGWHLPTEEEWTAMAAALAAKAGLPDTPAALNDWKGVAGEMMCPYTFNGEQMQEYQPGVNKTDNARLSVKMLGYGTAGRYFNFFGEKAAFWTATPYAEDGTKAWCRFFSYDSADVQVFAMSKASFSAQVRCIKD